MSGPMRSSWRSSIPTRSRTSTSRLTRRVSADYLLGAMLALLVVIAAALAVGVRLTDGPG
jgi:hypothetical protein